MAEGCIRHAHAGRKTHPSPEELTQVLEGTLTLPCRLLFLLYAEARDLLPVRKARGYYESSLRKVKGEIVEAAGVIEARVAANLKKAYGADSTDIYDRLARVFQVIDRGIPEINVPVYNGGLFLSDPSAPSASNPITFMNASLDPAGFSPRIVSTRVCCPGARRSHFQSNGRLRPGPY